MTVRINVLFQINAGGVTASSLWSSGALPTWLCLRSHLCLSPGRWGVGGWGWREKILLLPMEFPAHPRVGNMRSVYIFRSRFPRGYWEFLLLGLLVGSVERVALGLESYPHLYAGAGFVGRHTFQPPIVRS